jgi:hypothetical protein
LTSSQNNEEAKMAQRRLTTRRVLRDENNQRNSAIEMGIRVEIPTGCSKPEDISQHCGGIYQTSRTSWDELGAGGKHVRSSNSRATIPPSKSK